MCLFQRKVITVKMVNCYVCKIRDASFRFPRKEQKLREWLNALEIHEMPATNARICSEHFSDGDVLFREYASSLINHTNKGCNLTLNLHEGSSENINYLGSSLVFY